MPIPSIHHSLIIDKTKSRAFINDTDIVDPKTGKLGFRIYKNDTFGDKFVLFFKKIFLRTVTFKDGSGRELIASKESLKNWFISHGKDFPSGKERFNLIDQIFDETLNSTGKKSSNKKVSDKDSNKNKATTTEELKDQNGNIKVSSKETNDLKKPSFEELKKKCLEDFRKLIEAKNSGIENDDQALKETLKMVQERINGNKFGLAIPFSELKEKVNLKRFDDFEKRLNEIVKTAETTGAIFKYNFKYQVQILEKSIARVEKLGEENEQELNEIIQKPLENLDEQKCIENFKTQEKKFYEEVKDLKAQIDLLKKRYKFVEDNNSLLDLTKKLKDLNTENREVELTELAYAVEVLGEYQNPFIENFLIDLQKNPKETLSAEIGELLATIWIKRDAFDLDNYNELEGKAKEQALELLMKEKGNWVSDNNLLAK